MKIVGGPKCLPDVGRALGQGLNELRTSLHGSSATSPGEDDEH